jgi:uncharacterized membrane protein
MLRILFVGLPALMFVLGIPLAMKLVPPNRIYGFRTSTTFSSPEAWYQINFALGLALITSGIVAGLLALLVTSGMIGLKQENQYIVGILLTVIIMAVFTIPVIIYSNKF